MPRSIHAHVNTATTSTTPVVSNISLYGSMSLWRPPHTNTTTVHKQHRSTNPPQLHTNLLAHVDQLWIRPRFTAELQEAREDQIPCFACFKPMRQRQPVLRWCATHTIKLLQRSCMGNPQTWSSTGTEQSHQSGPGQSTKRWQLRSQSAAAFDTQSMYTPVRWRKFRNSLKSNWWSLSTSNMRNTVNNRSAAQAVYVPVEDRMLSRS